MENKIINILKASPTGGDLEGAGGPGL